jgi:predicted esterase
MSPTSVKFNLFDSFILFIVVCLCLFFQMSSASKEVSVVLPPHSGVHKSTVIFLHGLGDEGSSWAAALADMRHALPDTKFICPTAPVSPVTINGGHRMTSWHDIRNLNAIDDEGKEQFAGVEQSVDIVQRILESELASCPDVPARRIVLGGFSQGAAMSIRTGFTIAHRLAGIVAMSGYLVQKSHLLSHLAAKAKETPALVLHGKQDRVVAFEAGQRLHATLVEAGIEAQMHAYPRMGHSTCVQEMEDLLKFLKEKLYQEEEKEEKEEATDANAESELK